MRVMTSVGSRAATDPEWAPAGPRETGRAEVDGTWQVGQEMVGFNQGSTAARTAPLGSGAIWLQSPTPGDQ